MDLFHKIQSLVDKNSDKIPEGDYLELCNTIKDLRDKVKPPRFLLDQNQPLWISDYDPQRDGPTVYEPTIPVTDGQPPEWIDEEENLYPGLSAFLEQLHAEWAATDNAILTANWPQRDEPVEPGAYYPPQTQEITTTVVRVELSE